MSYEEIRDAFLAGAAEIEKLRKENAELRELLKDIYTDWWPNLIEEKDIARAEQIRQRIEEIVKE